MDLDVDGGGVDIAEALGQAGEEGCVEIEVIDVVAIGVVSAEHGVQGGDSPVFVHLIAVHGLHHCLGNFVGSVFRPRSGGRCQQLAQYLGYLAGVLGVAEWKGGEGVEADGVDDAVRVGGVILVGPERFHDLFIGPFALRVLSRLDGGEVCGVRSRTNARVHLFRRVHARVVGQLDGDTAAGVHRSHARVIGVQDGLFEAGERRDEAAYRLNGVSDGEEIGGGAHRIPLRGELVVDVRFSRLRIIGQICQRIDGRVEAVRVQVYFLRHE